MMLSNLFSYKLLRKSCELVSRGAYTELMSCVTIVLKFMTISLEEEQHGEDEMQDVDAKVNTLDEEVSTYAVYNLLYKIGRRGNLSLLT